MNKKTTHMFKLFFVSISSIVILAGIIVTAYLAYDGTAFNPPLTITSDTTALPTDKQEYSLGEMVRYKITFCKHRQLPAIVQWSLIDSYLTLYPSRTTALPVGCYTDVYLNAEKIPMNAISSTYRFEGYIRYAVNSTHEVSYFFKTQQFTIKK